MDSYVDVIRINAYFLGIACRHCNESWKESQILNPAIDIGQIEGGFIQGLGLFTLEEPLFSPATGQVITGGPSNYMIFHASSV